MKVLLEDRALHGNRLVAENLEKVALKMTKSGIFVVPV